MLDECPEDLVRRIAVDMVFKWHWQLATVEELVGAVCRNRQAGELTDKHAEYHVRGEYGRCLYAAAQGDASGRRKQYAALQRRQERAYTEIGFYLRILARGKGYGADDVQEAVQAALVRIHSRISSCKNPAAFLHWCWIQLWEMLPKRSTDSDISRSKGSQAGSATDAGTEPGTDKAQDLTEQNAADPEQWALCVALWRQFLDRVGVLCAGEARRASKQISAVLLKFLGGVSDAEIAARLETTTANVQVLRARGLDRLRGDGEILQISQALRESRCEQFEA